jgi:hypothetical protein
VSEREKRKKRGNTLSRGTQFHTLCEVARNSGMLRYFVIVHYKLGSNNS